MERLKHNIIGLIEQALALVYPSRCPACKQLVKPGTSWCAKCWPALALTVQRPYCSSCGRTTGPFQHIDDLGRCNACVDEPKTLTKVCRVGDYSGELGSAIRNFKYQKVLRAGYVLGDMLASQLGAQEWVDTINMVVPIPASGGLLASARFSHTKILTERVAKVCSKPAVRALASTGQRRRQVGLSAAARVENVKGAFKTRGRFPLQGASVCLIDDVMTTGATLREGARMLLDAGAQSVFAAVVARQSLSDIAM